MVRVSKRFSHNPEQEEGRINSGQQVRPDLPQFRDKKETEQLHRINIDPGDPQNGINKNCG